MSIVQETGVGRRQTEQAFLSGAGTISYGTAVSTASINDRSSLSCFVRTLQQGCCAIVVYLHSTSEYSRALQELLLPEDLCKNKYYAPVEQNAQNFRCGALYNELQQHMISGNSACPMEGVAFHTRKPRFPCSCFVRLGKPICASYCGILYVPVGFTDYL